MEEEVDEVVGSKGKHNAERTAVRHGHESGEVTLGGRRVQVERPRVREADGSGPLDDVGVRVAVDGDAVLGVDGERVVGERNSTNETETFDSFKWTARSRDA
jgi:hypothetical protein